MSSGVSAAKVSRDKLGSDAITLLRSTKPGRLTPTRFSSAFSTRTPLIAMSPIFIARGSPPP